MSKIPKPYGMSPRAVVLIVQQEDGSTTFGGERREEILPEPWAPLDRALGELLDGSPAGHAAREALAMMCPGVGRGGTGALAHALVGPLTRLRGLLARDGAEAWWTERDGMLAADAALLDALDEPAESEVRVALSSKWGASRERITAGRARVSLRPPGSALAERLMEPHWGHWPKEPRDELSGVLSPFWLRWIRPTERGKGALAIVTDTTWERRVRGPIESKRGTAVPSVGLVALADVTTKQKRARPRTDGQYELLLPDERVMGFAALHPRVASLTGDALGSLVESYSTADVERVVGPSSSSLAIGVVRFLLHETFDRWVAAPPGYRPEIVIQGGFQALAARMGIHGRKQAVELRAVLQALDALRLDFGNGVFGEKILTLEDHSPLPAPGRPAEIIITPGNVLRPESVHALARRTSDERARARLVPIPRLTPAPVLAHRYRAGESVLQLLVMGQFAEQAPEFVERGGIEVTDRDWRALADRAGLAYGTVRDRLLPAWQVGEERFLAAYAGTRWTLGPAYEDERRHLELVGGMRLRATERGRRGARRRRGAP